MFITAGIRRASFDSLCVQVKEAKQGSAYASDEYEKWKTGMAAVNCLLPGTVHHNAATLVNGTTGQPSTDSKALMHVTLKGWF